MNKSSSSLVLSADTQNTKSVSDAIWKYMTSLKTVIKKSNKEQGFDSNKLFQSIGAAMLSTGFNDQKRQEKIAQQVIGRLQEIYDGHTTPTTSNIREIVAMTFIDNNLVHISRSYIAFKQDLNSGKSNIPVYSDQSGIKFERFFTKEGLHPYDEIEWEMRTAKITDTKGEIIFEQNNIETPKFWSQTATNIVVQKYFRGQVGTEERETSIKQLIGRVASSISNWGRKDGYFASAKDAQIFEEELTYILVNQKAAFNSPVWFNVGIEKVPQCSACFINSVEDDMRSILQLVSTESMLFKNGSGAGSNLSTLRSTQEFLGGSNGKSSGPVSFMKGFDAFAGIIKSGGKTRRAAKMVILNIDHPDIVEFIESKVKEEKKAWALMDAGYDGSMDGEAYSSVFFQNANNSVRVTDAFMQAVEDNKDWVTHEITTGKPSLKYKARDLLKKMSKSTWECGDPGIQYDTAINKWHTSKKSGRINASNPCSEYMFLDDSACNLSSLNLMSFQKDVNGKVIFDVGSFESVIEIMITAMEIIIGNSHYPTPAITQNSYDYRPLGIGYANLGALLMSKGLAYDSDEGRNLAAAITSVLSGKSYHQSTRIAEKRGAFKYYNKNKESFLEVMEMHNKAAHNINTIGVDDDLLKEAQVIWDRVLENGKKYGFKNAQVSVLAPTGTISFFMDCDTTGVEPDIALVKYKWLVGGGMMKIVNNTVKPALDVLGYNKTQADEILNYISNNDTIEGAPYIRDEHLKVFDCAFRAKNGKRSIDYMGHLRMMSAVQPFLSGAISKTVNMPKEATVEDIEKVYITGWKMGLKAIAIYRDGSKRQQALTTSTEKDPTKDEDKEQSTAKVVPPVINAPRRRRLPDERKSITHRFAIANYKGYMTVGLYSDGTPGEVFVTMAKQGSVISGLMDAFATSISMALQYGVPLHILVNKFVHMRFEPSGFTQNPNIRVAKSIVDYMFRWLAIKFLSAEDQKIVGINNITIPVSELDDVEISEMDNATDNKTQIEQVNLFEKKVGDVVEDAIVEADSKTQMLTGTFNNNADAPACDTCGAMMVRNGSCYKCLNCGATSGCS